jgi:hypothetical protein
LKPEEQASALLAGGIIGQGYQCGMLWGAALAAGARAYRRLGPGAAAEAEALATAQRLVEAFRKRAKEINCSDIIHLNLNPSSQQFTKQILKFFLRGGPLACFGMSAAYAQAAYDEIKLPASEERPIDLAGPLSCTALLARRLDESDLHVVMAAGLAGGIGLSGGACGALGAAIWFGAMQRGPATGKNLGFDDPQAQAAVERFLESSDYEFECERIAGRKFKNVADHAGYLHAGGCAQLITALAVRG